MSMSKQSVFVSGASRGIGRAIAIHFAKKGYQVAINCKSNKTMLSSVKDEIEAYNVPCIALVGDLSQYQIAKHIIGQATSFLGKIDVLINNAGISYIGLLTDMTKETWQHIIDTNLTSVFNCCHNVIPQMVHSKSGHIINISSVWGEVGASCEVAYSTSKGAINAFTKALAKELAPSHIYVNAIACGAIDTDMNNFLGAQEKKELIEDIPMTRLGKPNEVANLAYYLAEQSSYITGQIIRLDGGWV